jgi:hypothetical protein
VSEPTLRECIAAIAVAPTYDHEDEVRAAFDAADALEARLRETEDERDALRGFAREIIEHYQLEVEGVQDAAEKHGLLAPVHVTEACGEDCACVEYGFPVECFRRTALLGAP